MMNKIYTPQKAFKQTGHMQSTDSVFESGMADSGYHSNKTSFFNSVMFKIQRRDTN